MHKDITNKHYTIKAIPKEGRRPIELSSNMKPHPLSYMELPFEPEYSLYNNRMTPERLNHVTDDEMDDTNVTGHHLVGLHHARPLAP